MITEIIISILAILLLLFIYLYFNKQCVCAENPELEYALFTAKYYFQTSKAFRERAGNPTDITVPLTNSLINKLKDTNYRNFLINNSLII